MDSRFILCTGVPIRDRLILAVSCSDCNAVYVCVYCAFYSARAALRVRAAIFRGNICGAAVADE